MMKSFSDEQFWELIANDLTTKSGLGPPADWSKSIIELFIFEFLEALEESCKGNVKKAMLCNVPRIKNKFLYDQLRFSYDSFRRIFITKESKGNKTSKNMFAIYLGYNSYLDYWSSRDKMPLQVDSPQIEEVQALDELCKNRLRGVRDIDSGLRAYINQSKPNKEIAIIELALHFFAKKKTLQFLETSPLFKDNLLSTDFSKRVLTILECLHLITKGDHKEVLRHYRKANSFSKISMQEIHFLALWEGIILLSCKEFKDCSAKWTNLSGPADFSGYPFVNQTRKFDRAVFKVLFGDDPIPKIIASLDLSQYKGLAHLSAATCKFIRKHEFILDHLMMLADHFKWKNKPHFQTVWERLKQYEKGILSNAGTLFINN